MQKWINGNTWVAMTDLSDDYVNSLCIYDSGAGNHIYGGTSDAGELLEFNGVSAWIIKATVGGVCSISSILVHNAGVRNYLYAVTASGSLLQWDDSDILTVKASSGTNFYAAIVYNSGSGNHIYCAGNDGKLYEWNNIDTLTAVTGVTGASIVSLAVHDGYLYAGTINGKLFQWNKSNAWVDKAAAFDGEIIIFSLISFMAQPNLDGIYQYFYSYYNSITGQESALSPISNTVTATWQNVNLSNLYPSSDTQVNKKRIYRTGGTLSTINFIAEIANATTTYQDNLGDSSVGNLEDCSRNDVLPAVRSFSIHHHQLFAGYSDADNGNVFDSRFYQPESCPDSSPDLYFFKVGNDSDPVVAVMPLDIDMIVYTKLHTFRLRYIGTAEGDMVLEEIAGVGLASDNTLVTCLDSSGRPFHLFFGQSPIGPGIYRHDGSGVSLISRIVDPIFTGENAYISGLNWTYIDKCCGVFAGNKYYLAYPEGTSTDNNKVLVIDFAFNPPSFSKFSFQASAMVYDPITREIIFGGTAKEVYKLTGTSDWVSGAATGIALIYQTPYIGNRNQIAQAQEIAFSANTGSNTLTVKVYADGILKQTLTTSTAAMGRVKLTTDPTLCMGKMFSVRFEITSPLTSKVKISTPLELKVSPFNR